MDLEARVEQVARGFTGRFGYYARDLRTGEELARDADRHYPSASTVKLFILRELFRRADAGEVDLEGETIAMSARDRVPGSGVMRDLTPGLRLNLRDLATLMVTVSDNTASNLLIKRLSVRAINRGAQQAGYADTYLRGLFFRARGPRRSYTTPRDLARFMAGLAGGREVSRQASRQMLEILFREDHSDIIGRRIPFQPDAKVRPRWRIATKSGSTAGVRNDAGYVVGPGCRYALALMSEGCADHRYNDDNEANLVLAEVAREIHEWFTRPR